MVNSIQLIMLSSLQHSSQIIYLCVFAKIAGNKQLGRVHSVEDEGRKVEAVVKEAGGVAALAVDEAKLSQALGRSKKA